MAFEVLRLHCRALLWIALPLAAQPVDGIVTAYLKGAMPPPVADAVFARRVYFDVWGLPPTPGQLDTFLNDRRPGKRERLVDDLLANRRNYAAHWMTFWNDHLRNDQGVVYHGERKPITAWLQRALEENLPYDRFVAELLDPPEKTGPDGFLIGVNWRGDISASQIPAMQAAQNSAQVFLGVNLKCNSCHDSFISRWKLKDAYGLASYFAAGDLEIYRCDVATGETASPKFLFDGAAAVPAPENRRAEAARLFTSHRRLARTYVNRVWKTLFGRGLVATVDDLDARPWSEELLGALAADFAASGYDMKRLLRTILVSRTYQMPSVAGETKRGEAFVFRGPLARRLTAEQFADAVAAVTGEWRATTPRDASPAVWAREFELKSTALTRGLGRPIRDQVVTERLAQPTALEAIELANGPTLARTLDRGARRMLGLLPAAPSPVYNSGAIAGNPVSVSVELNGARKLWLLIEDVDTYDPARVVAGWAGARLYRGDETVRLADLLGRAPPRTIRFRNGETDYDLVPGAFGAAIVVDVEGFECFHALAGVDQASVASDIGPRLRFLVYASEPDLQQLLPATGEPPVAATSAPRDARELARRIYRHALSRDAIAAELEIAAKMAAGGPEGLADLLWAVFSTPEFQYLR
jgi:hypothetical protein